MSEPKSSETKPKKMVRRGVVVALGIICIILVAGLVGGFEYFMLAVNDKDNTISSLNSQISQLRFSVFKNEVFSNDATITGLQKIANLQESVVVLDYLVGNPQDSSTVVVSNNTILPSNLANIAGLGRSLNQTLGYHVDHVGIDHAGYIVVNVFPSNSVVELEYSSNGQNYNNTVNLGYNTISVFPVLPTSTLTIRVGNADTNIYPIHNGPIMIYVETVTIAYYY